MGYSGNHIEFDEVEEQNNKLGDRRQQIEKGQTSGCLVFVFSFLAVVYVAGSLGLEANSGWVALLIIIATIIVFVCVLVSRENKTNDKLERYREEIKVEQHQKRDVMSEVFIRANLEGFVPTTVIYDPDNRFCISVDNHSKRFLVKNTPGTRYTIYRFSDLIDFELSQDGMSILSGNEREALMGGILFGTTGAVIGASTSREVQEYCSSLYVALTVNNIESFRVKIPLITERTSKASRKYSFALERAKEMIALLQLIKNDPEKNNPVLPVGRTVPQISSETVEMIKEYKELMDLGIITKEEYEQKRKELSNI